VFYSYKLLVCVCARSTASALRICLKEFLVSFLDEIDRTLSTFLEVFDNFTDDVIFTFSLGGAADISSGLSIAGGGGAGKVFLGGLELSLEVFDVLLAFGDDGEVAVALSFEIRSLLLELVTFGFEVSLQGDPSLHLLVLDVGGGLLVSDKGGAEFVEQGQDLANHFWGGLGGELGQGGDEWFVEVSL